MIKRSSYQPRPMFRNPEDWLQHYLECREFGRKAWEPATRDELLLAESSGLLQLHPEWLPSETGLRILGLPPWFGRRQAALSGKFQERFVQTLLDSPETLQALQALILEGYENGRN